MNPLQNEWRVEQEPELVNWKIEQSKENKWSKFTEPQKLAKVQPPSYRKLETFHWSTPMPPDAGSSTNATWCWTNNPRAKSSSHCCITNMDSSTWNIHTNFGTSTIIRGNGTMACYKGFEIISLKILSFVIIFNFLKFLAFFLFIFYFL